MQARMHMHSTNGSASCALSHLAFACEHVHMGSGHRSCASVGHTGACNVSCMPGNTVMGGGGMQLETSFSVTSPTVDVSRSTLGILLTTWSRPTCHNIVGENGPHFPQCFGQLLLRSVLLLGTLCAQHVMCIGAQRASLAHSERPASKR